MYKNATFLILLLFVLPVCMAQQVAPEFGDYAPAPAYSEITHSSFYITMRDGVKLAVNTTRPVQNGQTVKTPLPVIWHHTLSATRHERDGTGGHTSAFNAIPQLAKHGYVVVQVARRGNGQSFGVRRGYHDRNEAQDAYEITQWLAKQSWSNGTVGLYGCSNTGDAALHAMTVRPPALKAVFAGCFSWHKYDAFRRGGIFAQWGTGASRTIEEDMQLTPIDGDENKVLLRQAAEAHQLSTPLLDMWQQLPYRDSHSELVGSRFWAEGSNASYLEQIKRSGIPLYILGGWHDELRDQGFITFLNIPNSRVIMGPWSHCVHGDFPLLAEIHRFFDYHLKGLETGIENQAKVHYFTMTSDTSGDWRATDVWPPEQYQLQPFFFSESKLKNTPTPADNYAFETLLTSHCEFVNPFAKPCTSHIAGASFTSDILHSELTTTGHPVIDMWISSTTPDAHMFAYLEDVAPDGTITNVTEGRLKASHRKTGEPAWKLPPQIPWHRSFKADIQPLREAEKVNLRFDLMPTSWVFKKGHRIRVSITGYDSRERLREPLQEKQIITIYTGNTMPSQINLPIKSE